MPKKVNNYVHLLTIYMQILVAYSDDEQRTVCGVKAHVTVGPVIFTSSLHKAPFAEGKMDRKVYVSQ
jgi:hypothetical protein